ncbi:MAG: hypothetical protein LHV69_09885 [Elusimicrobia bacterium]|nr:hypothetical protein [Candidatus Obscuribacterium magneticum]
MKLLKLLLVPVIFSIVLTFAYFTMKKFLRDRQAVEGYGLMRRPFSQERPAAGQKEVRTYTQKELEEARRKGQLPGGVRQPYLPPPTTTAGEAAVQRSLRTLEEINKINEMNRRLQEQQRRTLK